MRNHNGAVAAVDLGATSGRVVVGTVGPRTLQISIVARFDNSPVAGPDGMHWDVFRLYEGVNDGLIRAMRHHTGIAGVGVDSWGVDYGLLRTGRLLGYPFHYRDSRTAIGEDLVHRVISRREIFERTGVHPAPINTVYQLAAEPPGVLSLVDSFALMPDLFTFWLTGQITAEQTIASTTGLLTRDGRGWDQDLMDRLHLPAAALPPLVAAGDVLGGLTPAASDRLRMPSALRVIAVGAHDTASAVAATPMDPASAVYISCGTWGLVGVETEQTIATPAAFAAAFTNERGVDGRVLLQRNMMGLWLLSHAMMHWTRVDGEKPDLDALLRAAAACDVRALPEIDVEDPALRSSDDGPALIDEWCRARGLAVPRSRAETVRIIIESLARSFAHSVHTAASLSGREVRRVHLVGGGARNALLCQRIADHAGMPVLAGPAEATAVGNVLIQARTLGMVSGTLEALRALVRETQDVRLFSPTTTVGRV